MKLDLVEWLKIQGYIYSIIGSLILILIIILCFLCYKKFRKKTTKK